MSKSIVEINSQINELYAKTLITQRIKNESENPMELKIYVYKKDALIFSSFEAQIGDLVKVKSKVIKEEKAEEKYTDSISSGNAAIFVSKDPTNSNRIIINMGNIPPKQEMIFTSEFIQFIESSESYEFELFRNLPILYGTNSVYEDSEIKGKIEIKTNKKISYINKNILSEKLRIIEEKYVNEEKNHYVIEYEYLNISNFDRQPFKYIESYEDYIYIPSSKIYFELELNHQPIAFYQKSSLSEKEINYIFQYRNISKKSDKKDNLKLSPGLFIFLIDQSGSMTGNSIVVASKALLLFLQSLPAGSYYQIIGFGSQYKKYDETPKEYITENIKKSIKIIEGLDADLGGTDIYRPLKDIYDSEKIYQNINLPRNIFLLTDGEIDDKDETLEIIENNSDKYSVYSIGIGNCFDKYLIKNAGIIGKGGYNFCNDIKGLNEIIATEVSKACSPYISNFSIKSSLAQENIYKLGPNSTFIRKNKVNNFFYIIEDKNENNDTNKIKVNIEIKYMDGEKENKEICENYEIEPLEVTLGEELSKLIIYNYISNNSNLDEKEKIKLALKYQIFTEGTSLFAEVELSEKISEEMKTKIIGDKKNNVIKDPLEVKAKLISESMDYSYGKSSKKKKSHIFNFGFIDTIRNSISNLFSRKDYSSQALTSANMQINCFIESKECDKDIIEDKKLEIKEEKKITKKENDDQDGKEEIMEIINTQDFVEGFWDVNEKTKIVMDKYKKEFELLKGLKDKNIDDKIAMTVLIVYFIYKEHIGLLKELIMIINKAKLFIQEKAGDTYENIINEIGIN